MPRKVVRVYIPKQIKGMLEDLCDGLGLSESEVIRFSLLELASKHGIVTERIKSYVKL